MSLALDSVASEDCYDLVGWACFGSIGGGASVIIGGQTNSTQKTQENSGSGPDGVKIVLNQGEKISQNGTISFAAIMLMMINIYPLPTGGKKTLRSVRKDIYPIDLPNSELFAPMTGDAGFATPEEEKKTGLLPLQSQSSLRLEELGGAMHEMRVHVHLNAEGLGASLSPATSDWVI
ncbi:hypothetical protein Pelo_16274 [Pelomyxa schiedti]|nr:hypothetical protein Pelo_16274 [Pelomyxa schiedti]